MRHRTGPPEQSAGLRRYGSDMAKAPHHTGTHQVRARRVTDAANADSRTTCWQCGRTKAEHGRPWHAGHVIDGQAGGELRAECEQCNTSRGATLGNQRRASGYDWP